MSDISFPQDLGAASAAQNAQPSSAADPASASKAMPGAPVNSSTKVNSLEELRKKSPELYQKILEGIAMSICDKMRHHQERLKKMMAESRRHS